MEKTLPQDATCTGNVLKKGAKPEHTDVPEQKPDHAATSIGKQRASRGVTDQNSILPSKNGGKPEKCSFVANLFDPRMRPQSLHCRTSPQSTSLLSVSAQEPPLPPAVRALPTRSGRALICSYEHTTLSGPPALEDRRHCGAPPAPC